MKRNPLGWAGDAARINAIVSSSLRLGISIKDAEDSFKRLCDVIREFNKQEAIKNIKSQSFFVGYHG